MNFLLSDGLISLCCIKTIFGKCKEEKNIYVLSMSVFYIGGLKSEKSAIQGAGKLRRLHQRLKLMFFHEKEPSFFAFLKLTLRVLASNYISELPYNKTYDLARYFKKFRENT